MIIKNWLRGPWWDKRGVRHDTPVDTKDIPQPHRGIIGIVDCIHGISIPQGFTPRGVPLFLCYPIRSDYPPFLVAIKEKYTRNPIVKFNFEHWEAKWPRGGITHTIGFVGDPIAEEQGILESILLPRTSTFQVTSPDLQNHSKTEWDRVIHIDPPNCKDIDDICAWRQTDSGIEFMVGISDVSVFVSEDSAVDIDASQRVSSIYVDGHAIEPMLPTTISEGYASLIADGMVRPIVGLTYKIQNEKIIDVEWGLHMIAVNKSYTYDNVLGTTDAEIVEYCSNIIGNRICGHDSHIWIEVLMIDYNRRVAEILKDKKHGILRIHDSTNNIDYVQIAQDTGCADIQFLGNSSGQYISATHIGSTYHSGLNCLAYTHATSPLRRYADLVNQRWLKYILFDCEKPLNLINIQYMNHRMYLIKRTERLIMFSRLIQRKNITEVFGYVIRIKDGKIWVYIPSFKRTMKGIGTIEKIGSSVTCRIFCDIKQSNIESRFITQIL